MRTKTVKLLTLRTVRQEITHVVEVPDTLEGDELMAVLYEMEIDGLLEDDQVRTTDVQSTQTYLLQASSELNEGLLTEVDGLEVAFNDDGSISVTNTDESSPTFGTHTHGCLDPGPLEMTPDGRIVGAPPAGTQL